MTSVCIGRFEQFEVGGRTQVFDFSGEVGLLLDLHLHEISRRYPVYI